MKSCRNPIVIQTKRRGPTSFCYRNRFFRQKIKCTAFSLYVIITIWAFGVFLTNVAKQERHVKRRHIQQQIFDSGSGLFPKEKKTFKQWKIKSVQEILYTKEIGKYLESLRINPSSLLSPVDYKKIVEGDFQTVNKTTYLFLELLGKNYTSLRRRLQSDKSLIELTKNCTNFVLNRSYITRPMSIEEKLYPIAYVIIIHRKFAMFERLLRSIYHPQNIYCIHVDKGATSQFIDGVRRLSECFHNVFVASSLITVKYSHWSRVQADLNCLEDLIHRKSQVPWKYVINLCGQDFPLKTNLEITRALKAFRGYNNIESVTPPKVKEKRYNYQYEFPKNKGPVYATLKRTNVKKSRPPLSIFVGSAYYTWKRQAVEFMLTDPTVEKFFKWSKNTYSPDEHVWATLQRWYPYMPGSRPPHPKYDLNEVQTVTRLVKWKGENIKLYPKCRGQYVRGVCVYGVGDIEWLLQQHHIFANKFDLNVDPFAIDCLDVWLRNRTITQTFQIIANGT